MPTYAEPYTALVSLLAVALYFFLATRVAAARGEPGGAEARIIQTSLTAPAQSENSENSER